MYSGIRKVRSVAYRVLAEPSCQDFRFATMDAKISVKCPEDLSSLSIRDLNILLKHHGLKISGKKNFKVERLCEVYGFTSVPGSFQSVLADVRLTKVGWTKDIRKAPEVELCQVSSYLLKAHKTTTHLCHDDLEIFTPQNLKR